MTVTVQIDACPEVVYELIIGLLTLAALTEEAVSMERRKGDAGHPGAVFVGHNQYRAKCWSVTLTTTDVELGNIFATSGSGRRRSWVRDPLRAGIRTVATCAQHSGESVDT